MLGEIKLFAGDFEPEGWMFCDGRWLRIADYVAVYSVLGTRYGGDGVTYFALPDLRGRVPMGAGQGTEADGSTLTERDHGAKLGREEVSLDVADLPAHNHAFHVVRDVADHTDPANRYLAEPPAVGFRFRSGGTRAALRSGTIGQRGGGQSHDNVQPSLVLRYIIDIAGELPGDPSKAGPLEDPFGG